MEMTKEKMENLISQRLDIIKNCRGIFVEVRGPEEMEEVGNGWPPVVKEKGEVVIFGVVEWGDGIAELPIGPCDYYKEVAYLSARLVVGSEKTGVDICKLFDSVVQLVAENNELRKLSIGS